MKVGPVEVIVCAFPEPEVDERVIVSLSRALRSGAIVLLDLVFVTRDGQGAVHVRDLEDDFPPAWSEMAAGSRALTLLSNGDIEIAAASIGNSGTALVAALEHCWAQRLAEAVHNSGGVVALHARIPYATVVRAFEADGVEAT
jgi:hypothetical protein